MKTQLEEIKKYIEDKFDCKFRYDIKQNDDNEEYIEIKIKLEENKQELTFKFKTEETVKRDIKKQIHYVLDNYCSKNFKL